MASTWDRSNNLLATVESLRGAPNAVTSRTYDDFDRLESITDRWGNALAYAYDANGNRTRLTDPNGKITSYSYDALNRVASVLVPSGGVTEYEYFANSRPKKVIYPNGTTAENTWDAANRAATIDNRHFGGAVSTFSYGYDLNGNRIEQVESHGGQPAETTTYAYDTADRLLEVTYPDKITTYTYDDAGNRLSETDTDPAGDTTLRDRTYTYNDRNQITAVTDLLDASASVTYGYDANGNQVSRATGGGEVTDLTYDVRDRLTTVTKDAVTLGTYGYDHQGLRVSKQTAASGLERYVYDDQSVLLRTSDTGRATKYDYGPFRLLSVDDTTDGRAYYLFDALGSISDLTDPQGVVLARYLWDAWGNKRESIETGANPFGFTGHEHDAESGLIYAKARFYDPEIGIFLSEDPVAGDPSNPPSLHRYLYAYQNPTVYVDPDGRITFLRELADAIAQGDEITDEFLDSYGRWIFEDYPILLSWLRGAINEDTIISMDPARDLKSGVFRGIVRGLILTGEEGVRALNAIVNLQLLIADSESELGRQAKAEFDETVELVWSALDFAVENPDKVGVQLGKAGLENLQQNIAAVRGDPAALEEVIAENTPILISILSGASARGFWRNVSRKVVEEVGESTGVSRLRSLLPERSGSAEVSPSALPPPLLPEFSRTTIDNVLASSRLAKGKTTRGASLLQKRIADGSFADIKPTQANAEQIISDVLESPLRVQQPGRFGQFDVVGRSFGQEIGIRINTQTGRVIGFRRPDF
ncbi:MAG: RHS repeat-associated core domain-containing protein [bacterium]|nr:RHS repeat-associated core domain-containing protein [bacterium]